MAGAGHLHTGKTWTESLQDLKHQFELWGIKDYALPRYDESRKRGYVEVQAVLGRQWRTIRCGRFSFLTRGMEHNLRAIVLAVEAVRMADQRGIGGLLAEFSQHLSLPPGNDPYRILGVQETAPREEVEKAYRDALMRTHPDKGGKEADFIQVRKAGEALGLGG